MTGGRIRRYRGRLPASGQLIEGGSLELADQRRLRFAEDAVQRTGIAEGALVGMDHAEVDGDRPVDGFDDFQYRDLFAGPGQADAAARASTGADDAGRRKTRDDLGEERGGDLLFGGDFVGGDLLAISEAAQVKYGAQRIVGLFTDLHGSLHNPIL